MSLIKCPECQHEVSTLAATCPNCGVRIADNIVTCPDCGKVLLKNTAKCLNCGCSLIEMPVAQPTQLYDDAAIDPTPRTVEPTKAPVEQRSYVALWTFIVSFILVAALGGGGYYIYQLRQFQQEAEDAFNLIADHSDPAEFEDFLSRYPRTEQATQALARLSAIRNAAQNWAKIDTTTSCEQLREFIAQCDVSAYTELADRRLDSLDWMEACNDNTQESLAAYLNSHPEGRYRDLCMQAKDNLDKTTVLPEERTSVINAFNRYLAAISSGDAAALGSLTSTHHLTEATDMVTALHAGGQHVQFTATSAPKVYKVPTGSGAYIYVVKAQVARTLSSSTNGTTTRDFAFSTNLSPDFRIISSRSAIIDPDTE